MSFILDALKKSDAERRLGHAPTLGGHGAASLTESAQELGPLTWVMSSILAVALLAIGWVWFQAPEGNQSAATLAQQTARDPVSSTAPATTSTQPEEEPQMPAEERLESEPDEQPTRPGESSESLAAVRDFRAVEAEEEAVAEPAADSNSANEVPVDGELASEAADAPADVVAPRPVAQNQPRAARPQAQESEQPPEPARPKPANPEPTNPEPIFRYELPANIRGQLPEFNVAVQVYDDDPAARFAIINGERFLEGDALQGGLVLKQIRRQDLVFTFRRYEFKVTP